MKAALSALGWGGRILLVGFVVLLERRIIDTTVKVVQRAVDAERQASDARIERMVGDFEDRMATEWARFDPANAEAVRRRSAQLTDEMVEQVVDEATLAYLADYRFSGDIWGYPEGEVYFPGSPVL